MNKFHNSFLILSFILLLSATPAVSAVESTLPGVSVSGTNIVANGQPITLRGINMGDPFWARNPDWYNFSLTDYNTISNNWGANVVRISIFPTQWKNMDPAELEAGLSQEIDAALDHGMYVIISYHVIGWPDGYYKEAYPGNPADTYDSSMSVATSFWAAMAQLYGSDTRILFDLWNEPVHPDDFTLYGSDPNPLWPALKGYYETLIETVRDNGAQNIVIATGNRWASWLVGIKDNPLSDANVVYAFHQYAVDGSNTPEEWNKNTGGLVGFKPVLVTEWGYEDTDVTNPTWPGSEASYGDAFTQWMDAHDLGSLAWMYHYDWTPALLKPDGTLTVYGAFAKGYISSNATQTSLPPLDPALFSFQEIATGLTSPIGMANAGDGSNRLFVIERPGYIRLIKNGALQATAFLDIHTLVKSTGSEQGLLALAFHPDYETNGKFYVVYTAPRSGDSVGSNLVLEKFTVSANNADQADPGSGAILLTISHPGQTNHNGGTLAFGADGYLYWSTGDGGGGGDPDLNGQNLNSLLGKILRLDVDSGSPYVIPTSNPFVSSGAGIRKEIWAYGLRNPWRLSFDRLTHDLYIGDVGQGSREEVDYQLATSSGGENYGWNVMEGSTCYNAATCNQTGKVLPVAEYDHSGGKCSITGGYVYRGTSFPSLQGRYFYGDYCSGQIFSIYKDSPNGWASPVQIADTTYNISTFGEDETGDLYLANLATGKIYKLVYDDPIPSQDDFDAPVVIPSQPYQHSVDVSDATQAGDDPTVPVLCDGEMLAKGRASVWYKYIPSASANVSIDTLGSNYDTYLAVWTGTRNNLTLVGCDNDTASSLQSQLSLYLTAGTPYFIEVAEYAGASPAINRSLTLHITTFADVPGNHVFWRYIEGFYNRRITTGCGANPFSYCPDAPVNRAAMAVFILRAKYGASHVPDPIQTNIFSDLPIAGQEWMQPWIEEFYEEGVTTGCGVSPRIYCPQSPVTREAMAVFLLRAKYGAGYTPPSASNPPLFADVPVAGKEWMQPWIEEFYRQGYTVGCGTSPLLYCPSATVNRAAMAVFISRVFNIPQVP